MMRTTIVIVLFSGIGYFLTNCQTYRVLLEHDKKKKQWVIRMENNILAGDSDSRDISLNAAVISTKDGQRLFTLHTEIVGASWVKVKPGDSLELTVDGNRYSYSSKNGSVDRRERLSGGEYIQEQASWPIEQEDLFRLSEAKEVKIRIIGTEDTVYRNFTAENRLRFSVFYQRCILSKVCEIINP